MTRLTLTWAVACLATIGVAFIVPLGSGTAEAQVVEQADPQERDQAEPPVVEAETDLDYDAAYAPQPVNLVSATDEESRSAGDDEMPIQKNTLTELERTRFETEALTVLGLNAASVQEIEAVEVSQVQKVALTLNGIQRVLELYPHSLRSENFRVIVVDAAGVSFDVDPPPVRTYRGSVVGDITSEVAASVIDGTVHAIIRGRDGAWAVAPIAKEIAGAPADLHAVFRVADVAPHNGTCGVDDAITAVTAEANANVNQGAASQLGTGGRTQIAFDCDNEYYVANGSSIAQTINDLEMVMNQVALVYLGEFAPDICYVNEGIRIRTSNATDPYTSTNPNTLLCQFVDVWEANPPFSRFDVAHLMTGKNLDGTVIGIAWVGVICGDTNFPNCAGPAQPLNFGLSWVTFSTNLVARTALVAHELGHNWNACHCNQTTCVGAGNPADADCGIMWSGTGTQQSSLLFGSRSTTTMNAHRNSRTCLSTCLNPTFVDGINFHPFIQTGSAAFPFNTVLEGIMYVPVGGTVQISAASYPETMTINKSVRLNASGGTVIIGQ